MFDLISTRDISMTQEMQNWTQMETRGQPEWFKWFIDAERLKDRHLSKLAGINIGSHSSSSGRRSKAPSTRKQHWTWDEGQSARMRNGPVKSKRRRWRGGRRWEEWERTVQTGGAVRRSVAKEGKSPVGFGGQTDNHNQSTWRTGSVAGEEWRR